MGWGRKIGFGIQLFVLFLLVLLFIGSYVGQPILVSYVETDSMANPQTSEFEPYEMDVGDGFVAVPSELTGEPEPGDVVVFEAEEIQGGGLTTHLIVDETDAGYVTRGISNPFTDQDGGEPHVREPQIKAEALQVGGSVTTIPHLGTAVMGIQSGIDSFQQWLAVTFDTRMFYETQGLAMVIFALSIMLYIADLILSSRSGPDKDRDRQKSRESGIQYTWIILACAAIIMIAATAAMIVPGGTDEMEILSAEFDSDDPEIIQQGETGDVPRFATNDGYIPAVSYLEAETDGMNVSTDRMTLGPQSFEEYNVSITAPEETGHSRYYLTEHRYLHVLPLPLIEALHDMHPWLPIIAINLFLGGGIYALGRLILPSGRARFRTRSKTRAPE